MGGDVMTFELQSSLFDTPETVALMDRVSTTPLIPSGELFSCPNTVLMEEIRFKIVRSFYQLFLHDVFSWDFIRLSPFTAWKGMPLESACKHAWPELLAWMREVRMMYQEKEKSDRAGYLFLIAEEAEAPAQFPAP